MNKKNKKIVKIQDKKHEILSETLVSLNEMNDFSNYYEYHEKGRMFVGDDEYCHVVVTGRKLNEEPVDENKD